MHPTIKKKKRFSFYFYMGLLGISAVLAGFFTTYVTPNLRGTFKAPLVVHIHGGFAFGWIILFTFQSVAIRYRNFALHKKLGYLSLVFALGIIVTLLPVGMFQVKRDLENGMGYTATSQIVGILTTGLMFLTLVVLGYRYRKKPQVHKRLMLLATIILLWPAWFRFRHYFPSVPRPDIWFGVVLSDTLIIVAFVADLLNHRRIHPALLIGGFFIIAENIFEILSFDNNTWRSFGNWIYYTLN